MPDAEKPTKVDSLDDVRLWIAHQEGRATERRESLLRESQRISESTKDLISRVASIERKVMWLAGMAAAFGGGIGTAIARVLG